MLSVLDACPWQRLPRRRRSLASIACGRILEELIKNRAELAAARAELQAALKARELAEESSPARPNSRRRCPLSYHATPPLPWSRVRHRGIRRPLVRRLLPLSPRYGPARNGPTSTRPRSRARPPAGKRRRPPRRRRERNQAEPRRSSVAAPLRAPDASLPSSLRLVRP